MTDKDKAIEILKRDILSVIVTFETNFNEVVSTISYDSLSRDEYIRSTNDIQIFLEQR